MSEARTTANDLEQRIQEWSTAELNGDASALDSMLVDDFVGIGPLGFMLTKEQWLARYTSGGLHYDTFSLEEIRPRIYGDATVVTGRQAQTGSFQGNELPTGGRATLIWVRQDGRWLLAGWQLSPIAERPGL